MNPIVKCRLENANVKARVGDRTAVIVSTRIGVRKVIYGVQFWTAADISRGTGINGDMTTCTFIEILHPNS